eukprot:gb/GEZN01007088.1/.p1 GENE.gb/GEZN01007088.1/~~gb/GEZN01007088.1/.p1  ORF type:complete len:305 (+),score=32.36 gb/GEZN01007088.1/:22-936(+)
MAAKQEAKVTSLGERMVLSAFSGMVAATACHPLDTIRVQMQVDKEGKFKGMFDCGAQIYRNAGLRNGLYAGISAAYLRQWLYGSCRMGIYSQLLDRAKKQNNGKNPGVIEMAGMGIISGAIGSFVGNPSELALVRMTADSRQPLAERRNYTSVLDVIRKVIAEEGPTKLWRGATPTIIRASLLSASLMSTTSAVKASMVEKGWFAPTSLVCMFIATSAGSLVANLIVMPLDVVKSRIQNMKIVKGEAPAYAGMIDCAKQTVTKEGVKALWIGFTPAFIKLAPYSIISLTVLDQITRFFTGNAAL